MKPEWFVVKAEDGDVVEVTGFDSKDEAETYAMGYNRLNAHKPLYLASAVSKHRLREMLAKSWNDLELFGYGR